VADENVESGEEARKDIPAENSHADDEVIGKVLERTEEVGEDELKEAVAEHKKTGKPMTKILEKKKGLLNKIMDVMTMEIGGSGKVEVTPEGETLAEALVKAGWITEQQLEEAKAAAAETGAALGNILIDRGIAAPGEIETALAYRRSTGKSLTRALIDVRLGKAEQAGPKKIKFSVLRKKRDNELANKLVSLELIPRKEAEELLEKARKIGQPLDEYLVERDIIPDKPLALALADFFGIPYVDVATTERSVDAIDFVPHAVIHEHSCVPFKIDKNELHVAFMNPRDAVKFRDVGLLMGRSLIPYVAPKGQIQKAMEDVLPESMLSKRPAAGGISSKVEETGDAVLAKLGTVSIAELVDSILEGGVEVRATDIHLDPQENFLRTRYRIDGILHDVMNLPLELASPIISRIKVMANMDIIDRMHAQDGHINLQIRGRTQDLRVASAPTCMGEKVTIRVMDPRNVLTGLHQLGLEDSQLDQINQLIAKPYGMLLATGPVGSGKTTTLYSCLNKVNTPEKNVMTIEDPVEYRLRGMNQMQVDHKRNYGFTEGLVAMLRQDPNIIMVGEIRGGETAKIAVRASLTGVLVFSTMHANDGPGTIATLYNHGIPGFLVSNSLVGVVAQRLVRRLCRDCKEPYKPEKELLRQMKVPPDDDVTFYRAVGCPACFNTGYIGRTGIYEIMIVDDELRDLIFRETTKEVIRQVAIDMGMQTLKQSCYNKVKQGITSVEEYFRVIFI